MSNKPDFKGLKALFINCTLKKSPELSHTDGLMKVSQDIMKREGVAVSHIRFVDHEVATGIYPDMREYGWTIDEWPVLFKKIMDADILVIGSPIWLGERSSIATKLIERLYAMSSMTNDAGQFIYYGKVGGCIITGNEDGAKHCSMGILYSLQHIGFTVPPQADAAWLGGVGPGPSYLDEESGGSENAFTNRNTTFMSYNLLHLAKVMKEMGGFPNYGNSSKAWEAGEGWAFKKPE